MDGISKKFRAKHLKSAYAFDIADYDANARFLIGWPGYRTSRNKSGLGYVETQAEWAHMQGLFFRWLITGKFKTRNPFYLLFISIYGFMNASPILLFIAGEEGQTGFINNWLIFLPYTFLGILILINVVLSIFNNKGESITGD
jgi:hypothetical protein